MVRLITCWGGASTAKAIGASRSSGRSPGTHRCHAIYEEYTSGVLSFAQKELPPGGREKDGGERVLMPGLEKIRYSILWVEHQDKGRLELNFVIPNMELQTGKRLQPYYDRADRPRIDAWQTLVNHHYGLHDPNAPENRRILTLPDNLPETKQALAESVTRG